MTKSIPGRRLLAVSMAALAVLVLLTGCGGSEGPDREAAAPASSPVAEVIPTAMSTPAPTSTPSAAPETRAASMPTPAPEARPTDMPTPTPAAAGPRGTGEYDGVSFVVSDGSEATFTVEEQLVSLPLPNDAVLRTTALSGEVHLDGRPSVVQIDLQQLSSDQRFRDMYVRTRMFGQHPVATFTVPDLSPPDGLASGEEISTRVGGSLDVRGGVFPLEFEVEARDDGDSMFILGRTTFTWDQLEIPRPTARSVASIEDEVRVEILLAVVPEGT